MVLTKWHSGSPFSSKTINKVWDEVFDDFFYRWPKEAKPPMQADSVYNEDKTALVGFRIQVALAGFSEKDIKVFYDDSEGKLHIKGSNSSREEILDKFKCDFDHTVIFSNEVDVSSAKVDLKDGLLNIFLPLVQKQEKKVYLFG